MPDRVDTKSARRRTLAFVLASALAAVLVVLLIGPRLFSRHVLGPRLVEAARSALTELRDADHDRAFEHDAPAQPPGSES
jgi:hypothetical protein